MLSLLDQLEACYRSQTAQPVSEETKVRRTNTAYRNTETLRAFLLREIWKCSGIRKDALYALVQVSRRGVTRKSFSRAVLHLISEQRVREANGGYVLEE